MFKLYADKNQLTVRRREPVTSGSVNAYRARFEFSREWDGLERTAVFTGGGKTVSVLLDEDGECAVPWEALTKSGGLLEAGVYGARGGETVLPTVKANLGIILTGAAPGEDARPPAPDLWRQELDRKGDRLQYTEKGGLGLYAGEKLLSAVPPAGGGGGMPWGIGHGLRLEDGDLTVELSGGDNPDRTLPISAASVDAAVGNIEILLNAIRGG